MYLRSLLLLFLVSSTSVFGQYAVKDIPETLTKGVSTVMRNQETILTLKDFNSTLVSFKEAITVFNKDGLNALRTKVGYDGSSSIKNMEAKVYDANGVEIKKFKKRDFIDVSATGSSMYSDDRMLYIEYTPTSFPFTMEFAYEMRSSSTAFLPRWEPVPFYSMSVEKSSFSISNEKAIPIITRKFNLDAFETSVAETPTQYEYTIQNVMPMEKEALGPYYTKFAPVVRIALEKFQLENEEAYIKNWKDFGMWQKNTLLKGRDKVSDATITKINNLVAGVQDPKEKARLIYQYMQDKTRYVFIAIGIGGWQPSPAQEVDELSYGDCKGLTNYTKALLKTQGIDSYYTIVYAGEGGQDIDEDFVALQGNHVILTVPFEDENVFLECTSQQAPFNYLGDFTDNRKVLMVTPDGGVIGKTHTYKTEDNLQTVTANVTISPTFEVSGKIYETSAGILYGNKNLLETAAKDDISMYYKRLWGHLNNLALGNIDFKNDKEKVLFTESLNFETDNYISKAGDKILLNPNIITRYKDLPATEENRKLPLEIRRGSTYRDQIEILLPEGYTIEAAFEPIEITSEFGTYKASVTSLEGSKIKYERELVLDSGTYPKEAFNKYVAFIQQVVKKDRSKIVLAK
ncbi:DUF3857 domain-containing protein [Rasiella sp. SM2506]|uniref:DUF3857 domain-containing protein n=1 Tax=Rasiella sp. SM2506 TaxID=3423914 RepID=UPI003D7BD78B